MEANGPEWTLVPYLDMLLMLARLGVRELGARQHAQLPRVLLHDALRNFRIRLVLDPLSGVERGGG